LFIDLSKDTLDDWIYYLKNDKIPVHTNAKGLDKAALLLKLDSMDTNSKLEYDAFIKEQRISENMLFTAKFEGREEGEAKKQLEIIISVYENGLAIPLIAAITKQSEDEITNILRANGCL
jgi:hypothetical protein